MDAEPLRQARLVLVAGGDRDVAEPPGAGDRGHRQTDRAGAEDQQPFGRPAVVEAGQTQAVDGHREGFGECGEGRRESLRNPVQAVCRHDHGIGEAAGAAETVELQVAADGVPALAARTAVAAGRERLDDDRLTAGEAVDSGAQGVDDAGHFMPHGRTRRDDRLRAVNEDAGPCRRARRR